MDIFMGIAVLFIAPSVLLQRVFQQEGLVNLLNLNNGDVSWSVAATMRKPDDSLPVDYAKWASNKNFHVSDSFKETTPELESILTLSLLEDEQTAFPFPSDFTVFVKFSDGKFAMDFVPFLWKHV